MHDHCRETGHDQPGEARPHRGERTPLRPGRRQVGEGDGEAGLQSGGAVTRQSLKDQVGQELAQEHQGQQEGEMGQAAGEEGRHHPVGEAAQQAGQADQVGLVLPAEVAGARKERREEGDLRAARKAEQRLLPPAAG